MIKRSFLGLLVVTISVLLLAGCTPKIGVDPKTIDFGNTDTEKILKVWKDSSVSLTKLKFKVMSPEKWIVGIIPQQSESKNKKDIKEIKIIASREGLSAGVHSGKIVISQIGRETAKIEINVFITVVSKP
ncbi:MAG TPA: hypothetical protein PLT82_06490, partial [Candidatus Hydrogenedens sp.]|nr:hypothetical protein [Candidatus Hydrogenedens sp.]